MNQYSTWKNSLIIIALILGIVYSISNIFGKDLAIQISSSGSSQLVLKDKQNIDSILSDKKISYKSSKFENNKLLIRFFDNENQLKAKQILKQQLGRNFIIALNLANDIPQWLLNFGAKALSLGLDLRGGVHFLLEVDTVTVIKNSIDKNYQTLRSTLRKGRLYKRIKVDNNQIFITLKNNSADKVLSIIKDDFADFEVVPNENTNLIVIKIKDSAIVNAKRHAIKQNIITLRNRVNELGVAEPIIQQQGLERIVVELPGVQDTARAKEILGAVATLDFRLVNEKTSAESLLANGRESNATSKIYRFKDGRPLLLNNRLIIKGENVIGASSSVDERGSPMVSLTLDAVGGRAMLATTKKNINHRMAVVFIENKIETITKDGKNIKKRTTTKDIINAATINGTFSTRFQITGLDSSREARDLALLLRAGSLSAPIEIVEERTIGPSLGADNIAKGIISVVVGFILVLLFMVWRYRVFGIVADIALGFNLTLLIAILSLMQATLTLPGIAGIVLTIGMAVDANVLIFERIKEELANGVRIKQAISSGYDKAFRTIADANITTLIASLVLFNFGTGPIKGFAITLSIGIITSMFTSIAVSRMLINFIYGNKKVKELAI